MKKNCVKLGNPIFDRMMFVLRRPITQRNYLDYRFMNGQLREIAPQVWAMPADLEPKRHYSLFFIFTKIKTGQTVVAFARGKLRGSHFDLGRPLTSGAGLNQLHRYNAPRSVRAAHFLNLISKAAEGDWRMVE